MRKARRHSEQEHSSIAVRVDGYDASTEAAIHHNARSPQTAWDLDLEAPLYTFETQLEIYGTTVEPKRIRGDAWQVTVYDGSNLSYRLQTKLKDIHVRDSRGSPQYKSYRGNQVLILEAPKGLSLIEKVRGKPAWTTWVHASPRYVSDVLALLGQDRQVYLAIHECKEGRSRWLQRLALQTTDPAEEEV